MGTMANQAKYKEHAVCSQYKVDKVQKHAKTHLYK